MLLFLRVFDAGRESGGEKAAGLVLRKKQYSYEETQVWSSRDGQS